MIRKFGFYVLFLIGILCIALAQLPPILWAEHPGETIIDPEDDVSIPSIDVLKLESSLEGEILTVIFYIKDIPSELTFNREGVPENSMEYNWSVDVDIDGDPNTGCDMGDYTISASHFILSPVAPFTSSIEDGVQTDVWQCDDLGCYTSIGSASINVDDQLNTFTLSGDIPGISLESNIDFFTFDYNPGGDVKMDSSGAIGPIGPPLVREEITITMELKAGWNMGSLPVNPEDKQVGTLFPDALAVFRFTDRYELVDSNEILEIGEAYWIYVPDENSYSITGDPIDNYSNPDAEKGWAMIGSTSFPSLPSVDNGSILAVFDFDDTYILMGSGEDITLLEPGQGYWICLSDPAQLRVDPFTDPNCLAIPNSGFEDGQNGWWMGATEDAESTFTISQDAYEGSGAAQLTLANDGYCHISNDPHLIEKSGIYTLSLYVKVSGTPINLNFSMWIAEELGAFPDILIKAENISEFYPEYHLYQVHDLYLYAGDYIRLELGVGNDSDGPTEVLMDTICISGAN